MANISASVKQDKFNQSFQSATEERVYTWDPLKSVGGYTTETVATHEIVPIPVGEALVGGKVIVTESFTSGGLATAEFKVGSDSISGVIPKANLAVGDVFPLDLQDDDATASAATYAHTTADTLDVAVGTAALTAGKAKLVLQFVKVADLQLG